MYSKRTKKSRVGWFKADLRVVRSNIIRHPVLLASSKEEGVEGTNSAIKLVGSLLFAPPPPPSP